MLWLESPNKYISGIHQKSVTKLFTSVTTPMTYLYLNKNKTETLLEQ